MEFSQFIEWCFLGILSASSVYGVKVLASLNNSIQDLNVKIAVVIEKVSSHEKRLDKHEEQLEMLNKI
jgi:hypothetical protein